MLKSGVSYYVYMKRVWIFDETLSCVFHILLHLSLPPGNSVSSYMCGHYLVSESESFQGCASKVRERAASQQGIQGGKRQGQAFFSPSNHSLYVLVRLAKMFLSFFVIFDLERKNAPHV